MLLIFIALLILYHKWNLVKFYFSLYFYRYTGRERSSTKMFTVNAGIANSVVKLGDLETHRDIIEPKSYTIDISFQDLGLTLKSVSFFNVIEWTIDTRAICTRGRVQAFSHHWKRKRNYKYKNSHSMIFLAFAQKRGLCRFSLKCAKKLGNFWNTSKWKRSESYADSLSVCPSVICNFLISTRYHVMWNS